MELVLRTPGVYRSVQSSSVFSGVQCNRESLASYTTTRHTQSILLNPKRALFNFNFDLPKYPNESIANSGLFNSISIIDYVALFIQWYIDVGMTWGSDDNVLYYNYYKLTKGFISENVASYIYKISDSSTKYFKIDNGAIIKNHLPKGILVLSEGDNYYLINDNTLKLEYTLNNMPELTFSPDGSKLFFLRHKKVDDEAGLSRSVSELYTANYNGKNIRKGLSYDYDPKNPEWLFDNKTISLDIHSQKSYYFRKLVLFDINKNKIRYNIEDSEDNYSSVTDPHYSPSGRYVVFDHKHQIVHPITGEYINAYQKILRKYNSIN